MANLGNMSPEAQAAWQALSAAWGQPLNISSAYRDAAYNAKVGGAKGSQHIHGNAYDVDVSGMPQEQRVKLIQQARAAGFGGIGVYDNSLHFDVGGQRAWGPSYHRDSLPDWAVAAVGGPVGQPQGQTPPQQQFPDQPPQVFAQNQDQPNALTQASYQLDPRAFMRERNALDFAPLTYERRNRLGSIT